MERTGRDTLILGAAVALLGILAYGNSLHGAFVFDDIQQIQDNPAIRQLGRYLAGEAGYLAPPNRFVAYLSFALNHRLGGPAPEGFHLVNLSVHLLNGLLVFCLVLLSFRTPRLRESSLAGRAPAVAFAAGALFVTHPIQTQAVSYVVQRITSLAALFYLAAIALYLSSRLTSSGRWLRRTLYGLALVAALLAMRTKEIAFTLPLALLLLEWALFGRPPPRQWLGLAPFGAVALVIPLSLLRLGQPVGQVIADASAVTRVQATGSRLDYLRTEAAVLATYLRLLVWPSGQNIDHDYPIYVSFLAPRVLRGLLVHASLLALAAWAWLRSSPRAARPVDPAWRLVSVGILLFFLAHLVESSLIPIVDVIFEHRVYLPSVGFFVAVATAGTLLARRLTPARFAPWVIGAAAATALLLAGATLARNRVWASDLALWTDAASKSPGKARPWFNLGTALAELGRDAEAVEPMRRAVQLDPGWAKARTQLGGLLILVGRPAEAEPELREALRLQPGETATMFNLAEALWRTGRRREAADLYQQYLGLTAVDGESQLRRVAAARVRIVAGPGG
jgi:Flp pilus assembly protein TadD